MTHPPRNLEPARRPLAWLALAVCAATGFAAPARAEDPPPAPPASYAGKDADWWVEELRGAGTARAATEALKVIGTPAIPAIARALRHHDPAYRQSAVALLREIPGDLRAAKDGIAAALTFGGDPALEQQLLELVGRLGPAGVSLASQVAARLESENQNVRGYALGTLEKIGGPAEILVPPLRKLLGTTEDGSVQMALRMLQRLGPEGRDAVPDVVAVATGQGPPGRPNETRQFQQHVRVQAIATLQRIGADSREARGALLVILRAPSDGLVGQAAAALAEIAQREPAAVDEIGELLAGPSIPGRRALLGALGSPRPLPAALQRRLVGLLEDGDAEVAGQAATLLAQAEIEPAAVVPALVAALAKASSASAAQVALIQIAQRDPVAFFRALPKDIQPLPPGLVQILSQHGLRLSRSPVRVEAITLLGNWFLRASGPTAPEATASEVLVTLGGAGGAELLACLMPMLCGEHAERGTLAARVLARVPSVGPAISDMLGGDESARRGALRVLALGGTTFTDTEEAAVTRLLLGTDVELRRQAALLLSSPRSTNRKPTSARPQAEREALLAAFLDGLRSPDPRRRAEATLSLGTAGLPSKEALALLLALVSDLALDVDSFVVAAAFTRVAATDLETAQALLDAEVAAADPLRRASALLARVTLRREAEPVLDGLRAALASGPVPARLRAVRATRLLGTGAASLEPEVVALIAAREPALSLEAVQTLALVAPTSTEGRDAVLALARDASKPWRREVIPMLQIYGGAAVETLVGLVGDVDMRPQALATLQVMGALAHDALPALEEELKKTPNDRPLRIAIDAIKRR